MSTSPAGGPFAKIPTYEEFIAWTATVPVVSRDAGLGPVVLYGTQRVMLRAILDGLRRGVHQFLATKGGQVGGSLLAQLIAAWWMEHCDGLIGVCAANDDEVREDFRQKYSGMMKVVCNTDKLPLDNKDKVVLPNQSNLMFMTAGPRSGARLAVGRGFAFFHGTEMALWGNAQAFGIARTRFSDTHPMRLLIAETTPRGRNWWYDVWEESRKASDIARIELYWWMREDYALDPASDLYARYWDGRLTIRERRWVREVERRFRHRLTPAQLAWRRYYVTEKMGGDDKTADQEMFTLLEEGFEATGISFLRDASVRRVRQTVAGASAPTRYRYEYGATIEQTELRRTIPEHAKLLVWEHPDDTSGYVVSAAPAHSATVECPDWVVTAWKASRDTLEQVAEFCDDECGMQQFAWACKHLIGSYRTPRRAFILEVAGMGMGVLDELRSLDAYGWGTRARDQLARVAGTTRNFMWRRPDSTTAAAAFQMRASPEIRAWIMTRFKDQVANGAVVVRSRALLAEIERVRQDGDVFTPEGREPADHRVWSAAMAVYSWSKQLQPLFRRVQGKTKATTVQGRLVEAFFRDIRTRQVAVGSGR